MAQERSMIPDNLSPPLEILGFDVVINENMPYANGVIAILTGQAQEDGNIITQDLQMAMSNTGTSLDEMTRFLFRLDDNLRAISVADPTFNEQYQDLYRLLYFTMFLEFMKLYSLNDSYLPPEEIYTIAAGRGVNKEMVDSVLSLQVYGKNMYAVSLKNPPGIKSQICPWVFIYNDSGKARLFLTKEEMEQYDRKYGKKPIMERVLDGKNIKILALIAAGVVGLLIGGGFLLKKKRDKKKEEEDIMINEIISEVEGDS